MIHFCPQVAHERYVECGLPVSHSLRPPRVSMAHRLGTAATECVWTFVFSHVQGGSQRCHVQLGA